MIKSQKYLVLIIMLLISCNVNINKQENALTKMNLNGKVKSLKWTSFQALIRNNNLVPEKGKRKIRELSYYSNYDIFRDFDENGNIINTRYYNSSGTIQFRSENIYNKDGYNDEINFYEPDGNLSLKKILILDKNNKTRKELWYLKRGDLDMEYSFIRNSKGKCIEKKIYSFNIYKNLEEIWRYKYNENGNLIEECVYDPQDNLLNKYIYTYDKNGNKISMTKYNGKKLIVFDLSYKLTYDKKNNWIKRIEFNQGVPEFIIEREIKYY